MFLDRLREMLIWTFPTGESACHNALCVFCVACVMQHLFNKGRQKCVVIDNVAYTVTMELYFSSLRRDIVDYCGQFGCRFNDFHVCDIMHKLPAVSPGDDAK